MNYSESMSKRQQRRKALNQRFRRMFLVALLMGLAMGFIFGRCSAVNGKAPDAPIEPDQLTAVTPDVTLEPVETPLVKEPAEPEPVLLGSFRITAYCSCEKCCGEWGQEPAQRHCVWCRWCGTESRCFLCFPASLGNRGGSGRLG